MKKLAFITAIFTFFFTINMVAQDKTDAEIAADHPLPGDNFSLEGALALFKKSKTLADFEKALNDKKNNVNNLDLDSNGKVDFVQVTDQMKDKAHAIVLHVAISKKENQDVAVIQLEQKGEKNAIVQIVGDKDVYGEEKIVEPADEKGAQGGKGGPSVNMETSYVVVNVWGWPSVQYVYAPVYTPYVSPYAYGVYPTWYLVWAPLTYALFYPHTTVYHATYVVTPVHRTTVSATIYAPHRQTTTVVRTTTHKQTVVRTNNGYRVGTKKTTTISGPNNTYSRTKTRTGRVNTNNGNVRTRTRTTRTRTTRRGGRF